MVVPGAGAPRLSGPSFGGPSMRTAGSVLGANVTTAVYVTRLAARGRTGLAPAGAASPALADALAAAAVLAGAAAFLSLASAASAAIDAGQLGVPRR